MKHVSKYSEWTPVNESISITDLQLAVILGIMGWIPLKRLIKSIAVKVGGSLNVEPDKLKKVAAEILEEVEKKNESGISLSTLKQNLMSKIDSGEIKTIGQLTKYFSKNL